jgi:hypothetical protein
LAPPTGFEPISEGGHLADTSGTERAQVEDTQQVDSGQGGQSGDSPGHSEDTLGDSACCACVAQPEKLAPDLKELVDAWPRLPEAVRAGILAMVRASG